MIERLRLLNPLQPGDESLVDPARREADLARILTMRTELGATDRRGDACSRGESLSGGWPPQAPLPCSWSVRRCSPEAARRRRTPPPRRS